MSLKRALPQVREIRLVMCQVSEQSKGLRTFVENQYVGMKKANPELPILIRESIGAEAKVTIRKAKGAESSAPVSGMSATDVESALTKLIG